MARSDNNLTAVFTDTANAIRSKTGGAAQISPRDFADHIATLHSNAEFDEIETALDTLDVGDGVNTAPYFIKVIDYDGTVLYRGEHAVGEFYELPTPPVHEGLTFDGWACSTQIVDNKVTVVDNHIMAGPMYHTTSGKMEVDITIVYPEDAIELKGFSSIDWGDGATSSPASQNEIASHTYSAAGDYTIKLVSFNNILKVDWLNIHDIIKKVRLSDAITRFADGSDNSYYGVSQGVFCYSPNLESISISSNFLSFGTCSFQCCDSLKGVVMPPSANYSSSYLFDECENLESIVIPESNVSLNIGYDFARNCSKLMDLVFPHNVGQIGSNAFMDCYSIQTLIIPKKCTQMGTAAFEGCHGIRSISFLASETKNITLKGHAFYYCYELSSVFVDDRISFILDTTGNNDFFGGCHDLTETDVLKLSRKMDNLGTTIFTGNYIIEHFDDLTQHTSADFRLCYSWEGLKTVTVPTGVTTLGEYAFGNCQKLQQVVIPNTVTTLNGHVFSSCYSLPSITLPSSVVKISGNGTFMECRSLKEISVASITDWPAALSQFCYGCISLQKVTLPSTLPAIYNSMFYRCSTLPRIKIPAAVTAVGTQAFSGCQSCLLFDFSDVSVVPTCQSNSFGGDSKSKIRATARIVVPDSLYADWIVASNWAALAAQIYPVSGYGVYDSTISDGSLSSLVVNNTGSTVISVVPDTGFTYPASVTVTGATASYDSTTGEITLSNPTANLTITAACVAL